MYNRYNIIAHCLTLTRLLLTPVFALCIYYEKAHPELHFWLKVILITVAVTDWMDGYVAKKWGEKSRLGIFLDPIADKIFFDTAIIMVSIAYDLPIWVTVILIGRDVGVLIAWSFFVFVSDRKYSATVHPFGKIMIALQVATIGAAVFWPNVMLVRILCMAAAFFSLGSAAIYLIQLDKYRKLIG